MCPRGDSNSQVLRHTLLKRACIPISALGLFLVNYSMFGVQYSHAGVVKLVYTQDLKSCGCKISRVGSTPTLGTGVWRNWLARIVWDDEVVSSSLTTPTVSREAGFTMQ